MKTKPTNPKQASKNNKLKTLNKKPALKPSSKPATVAKKAQKPSLATVTKLKKIESAVSLKAPVITPKPTNKFVKPVTTVITNTINGNGKAAVMIRPRLTEMVEVITFKSGDKIVYPGHGVGEIEMVRTTNIGGQEQQFYSIIIIDSGMKVMVPVSQAGAVGLRRIIDKKTIDQVYTILRDRNFKIDTQTWNRRFREYSQKIKTGSVYEIAVVLRDLSVLSSDKELSFGEKKMLDMAQNLLASEIAIAKSRPQDKIIGELREIFN